MAITPRFGIIAETTSKAFIEVTDGTSLSAVYDGIKTVCMQSGWSFNGVTLTSPTLKTTQIGSPLRPYLTRIAITCYVRSNQIEIYVDDGQNYLVQNSLVPLRLSKSTQYYLMASRYQLIIMSKGPFKGLISSMLFSCLHVPTIYLPNDLEGSPLGNIVNAIIACEGMDLFANWSGYGAFSRCFAGLIYSDSTTSQWTKTGGGGPLFYPVMPSTNFFPETNFKIKSPTWIGWSPNNPTTETPLLYGFLWDSIFIMQPRELFTAFNLDRKTYFPFAYYKNNVLCYLIGNNRRTVCSL